MCRHFFEPFLLGGCWTEGLAPGFGEDQKLQRRRSCSEISNWQLKGSHVSLAASVVVFGARQICFPNHEGQGKDQTADITWPNSTVQHKQQQHCMVLSVVFYGRSLEDFLFISAAPTRQSSGRSPAVFGDFLGLEGPGKHRNARIWFAIMWWSLQSNLGWKLEVFNLLVEGNVFHKWESESMMSISLRENEEKRTDWLEERFWSQEVQISTWQNDEKCHKNLIRVLRSRWSRYQELIHQHDDSIFTIHCHIFPLPGGTQKLGNSALQRFRWDAEVLRPRGCSLERNLPWRTLNLVGFEWCSDQNSRNMGMDEYLLIPFLVGWTSINPSYFDVNYRGTRVLTHCHMLKWIEDG